MNFIDWLKPGIRIKRWLLMGFFGLSLFVLGLSKILIRGPIPDRYLILHIYLCLVGIVIMYDAIRNSIKSTFVLASGVNYGNDINRQSFLELIHEQKLLVRGPQIVAIGGGTGLSTMIRGLKDYTSNITAIVTVADDGGGSGVLRESLKMLPPGDIRNCLVAMAHTEPVMEELMQYRFKDGDLKGQNFGNLFIAAMTGISSNFEEAIKKMSDVLAVKGKVYPVTLEDVTLCAELSNGDIIKGESKIPKEVSARGEKIEKIFLEPENPKPLEDALYAIENADCILIGPGSLYTSILPNLVISEIAEKIKSAKAPKIYISNIMTQIGETDGYNLSEHIQAINRHCKGNVIDFVIANKAEIPQKYYERYKADGQELVETDLENIPDTIEIIREDLVFINNRELLRHDTHKLATAIMSIILRYSLSKNKRRIMDYYYLQERIKERKKMQELEEK
jgi:uncharacterized cofD-like protein